MITIEQILQKFPQTQATDWHQHSNGGGWIQNTAKVAKSAYVGPDALVYDSARVFGSARVYESAQVYGQAQVHGQARVCDSAQVFGSAQVFDSAWVRGQAQVYDKAQVYGQAQVYGSAWVYDSARVCGQTQVYDSALVCGEACLSKITDYICISPVGTSHSILTLMRAKEDILISRGCFTGTEKEFMDRLCDDSSEHQVYKEVIPVLAKVLRNRMTPII